jgi:hypothetical protein
VTRAFRRSGRRGIALPLALFTIVIAAVMITAVFYVGRLEQRLGNNSIASTQAFEAAETGIAKILDTWNSSYSGMVPGDIVTLATTAVGPNAIYMASVRRLNSSLFLVQAEGRFLVANVPVTRRQVARLVRLNAPEIDPEGALTTRLGLTVTDNATIDGSDNIPGAWGVTCAAPFPQLAAIVDSAGAVVTTGPCTGQTCLTGTPTIRTTNNARMSMYNTFGSVTFAELAAGAEKVVSGSIAGVASSTIPGSPPTCNTADPNNWGDALDPGGRCGNYFPIIYAPGDLDLVSGIGQGVLLVQGNLTISGPFQFYGVIVVQGVVTATNGQVYGALMTASDGGVPSGSIGGTTEVKYSHCAIDRSLTGASVPDPLRERGWIQLY